MCVARLSFRHIIGQNQTTWNSFFSFRFVTFSIVLVDLQLELQWHNSDKLSGFLFAGQTRRYGSGVGEMPPPDSFKAWSIPISASSGIADWVEETDFDLTFSFSSFTLKCASAIIPAHKVKVQQRCWF